MPREKIEGNNLIASSFVFSTQEYIRKGHGVTNNHVWENHDNVVIIHSVSLLAITKMLIPLYF